MPALGLTDHGVMNGAVEHYKACKAAGIKPILGLEAYLRRRPPCRRPPRRAQPPDAPGLLGRGLPQPREAQLGRLPRRFRARQGQRRHGDARAPLGGPDRAHGLPPVALLPPARRGPAGRRSRPPRRPAPGVRPGQRLHGDPGQRDRRAGQGERGHRPLRPRGRAAAGRHRRRALPAPRGLPPPRRAALRADEVDARAAEAAVRHQRVLPEEPRGDAGGLRALARGGADDRRDRRALPDRDRARQAAAAALPDPRRRGAGGDAAPARRSRACARRYGDPLPPRPSSASSSSSASSATWASSRTS